MMTLRITLRPALMASVALVALTACTDGQFDLDMRDLGGSQLDTTAAVQNVAPRPQPDSRGVISYPNYQVAVATRGDTVASVAQRLQMDPNALARANALTPETPLNQGAVLVLPTRVAEPSIATGAAVSGPITPAEVDVTSLAAAAIDRAGPQATTAAPTATVASPTSPVAGIEPLRHTVRAGETAYTIARLYNLPVRTVAEWNGLGPDLAVREGQSLLIPQSGVATTTAADASAPGAGSVTPVPPSSSSALPSEDTTAASAPAPAAPALQTSTPASNAPLIFPVRGSILRAYAAGSNEGIDIGATAGADVVAAAAGTVAAITRDTNGIAIVVIRHATDLLTVYTNIENLTISEGAAVTQGQKIGVVKAGNPAVVHFEVRLSGMKSANPEDYLP